ncbi:hypothetical protein, partial [Staphylococcus aureus]
MLSFGMFIVAFIGIV